MKKLLFPVLTGLWLCYACTAADAQDVKTHINKEFSAKGTFALYNLSGSVKIEGYAGDKVIIDADQTIKPKNAQGLEDAKRELKIEFEQVGDSVKVYLNAPFDTRPGRNNKNNNDNNRNRQYSFGIDFTVKVPFNTNIRVSTINGGLLNVKDVAGTLSVTNVNGSISIENAKGVTDAITVNGKITASYSATPAAASNFRTVNGDIKATFPAKFAADLQLKTLNGGFYTNYSETEGLVAEVSKSIDPKTGMTTFKTNRGYNVRVGGGGKQFKFETVNGSIYIQKQP